MNLGGAEPGLGLGVDESGVINVDVDMATFDVLAESSQGVKDSKKFLFVDREVTLS